jgi:hypothetical protein
MVQTKPGRVISLQNHFLANWRGVLESNNKPDFGNLFWGKF